LTLSIGDESSSEHWARCGVGAWWTGQAWTAEGLRDRIEHAVADQQRELQFEEAPHRTRPCGCCGSLCGTASKPLGVSPPLCFLATNRRVPCLPGVKDIVYL